MDDEIQAVINFRILVNEQLQEFVNASQQLGEPIYGLANMVKRAFRNLLSFIIDGVSMERPDDARFKRMTDLLASEIADIQSFRDRNRQIQEVFNHLSTVSESIVALSWITVNNNPAQFVHDMRDAGQYFGNRVLSQYRGNQQHQEWINKWNNVLSALEEYVREYHRNGFTWNAAVVSRPPRPTEAGDAGATLSHRALVARSGPPPPPLPPAMDLIIEGGDNRQNLLRELNQGGDNRQNLLRDLNQGVDIVRLLRPVNREQPSQSQQSLPSTSGENVPRKPIAERTYPPKLMLDGRKWRVEHQKDRYDLVIDSAEMSHSLAMFKCQKSGLDIRNKLNGVTIDNCKRTTVVLRDIIASVELIGSQNMKLHCAGHVPLISVDNCDSVEIYLSNESLDTEVISSKSSSLNISIMKGGDYVEMAVPEQIKTVVVDGKLVSTVVEKK